ncbi:MAG: hypothetical protein MUE73_10125 [Planctomycetes bacterium]|jgi:hypothetical protein|nr:hypothetical protein [Planctomycetota bacterium]
MLILRKEQEDVLKRLASDEYECRVLAHVKAVFPAHVEKRGEPDCRRIIRKGIEESARYRIRTEFDVVRFIDLMFVLGEDFPKDSRLPWASTTLARKDLSPTSKVDQLWEQSTERLKEASGREV